VTNIAWTPIFLGTAAVVTDVGAPLSHVATVARELGIPPSSAAATRRYDCTTVSRSESTATKA
jgi:rifampicin phosphotransferase